MRRVLSNCVKPTHETLFADVPNLIVDYAIKMQEDRKLWRSSTVDPHCVANFYQGELQKKVVVLEQQILL